MLGDIPPPWLRLLGGSQGPRKFESDPEVLRNHPHDLSRMLELPEYVFPVAGLCVGCPAEPGRITPRLPLEVTVHVDRYDETGIREKIDAYDRRRHALQPYRKQRYADRYSDSAFYGWSEDKAR